MHTLALLANKLFRGLTFNFLMLIPQDVRDSQEYLVDQWKELDLAAIQAPSPKAYV